jgi:phosphatidylinositol glycan class U
MFAWLLAGFAARYAVFALKLQSGWSELTLVSTPSNSWTRVKEGHALGRHGVDPYDGDLVHASPVALTLAGWLLDALGEHGVAAVLCALDVLVAVVLSDAVSRLARHMHATEDSNASDGRYCRDARRIIDSTRKSPSDVAAAVYKLYLFLPFTVLNAAEGTTTVFTNLLLACFVSSLSRGWYASTALFVALAAHEELYPLVLLPPAAFVAWTGLYSASKPNQTSRLVRFFLVFLLSTAGLLFLSWHLTGGSWAFLRAKYGFLWTVPDLTPNMGLFWYFFTEMFEHFRLFFICSFQINAFIYAVPLLVKFHK